MNDKTPISSEEKTVPISENLQTDGKDFLLYEYQSLYTLHQTAKEEGFLPNPSKRCNPDFLANPTFGGDSYKPAKSSNFQILILESLPLVISLN